MADYGFVYCLGNDCMPGVFKIGRTERSVLKRASELSASTSVPQPFDVLFYVETDRTVGIEWELHDFYQIYRVSDNREFFTADIEDIWRTFERYADSKFPIAITNKGKEVLAIAQFERERRESEPPRKGSFMARYLEGVSKGNDSVEPEKFEGTEDGQSAEH